MRNRAIVAAMLAGAMAVASVGAQAAPIARASEPAAETNDLSRAAWILVVIALGLGLYFVLDDDEPSSP